MLQVGGDLDLFQESLGAEDGGELGAQHFHRHLAVVLDVMREEHRGHATGTEFVFDGVAIREGGGETVYVVRHTVLRLVNLPAPSSLSRPAARASSVIATLKSKLRIVPPFPATPPRPRGRESGGRVLVE